MNKALRDELLKLTPAERIDLIGELWSSLESGNLPPLSERELNEAERELHAHRAAPGDAWTWPQTRDWIRSRRK